MKTPATDLGATWRTKTDPRQKAMVIHSQELENFETLALVNMKSLEAFLFTGCIGSGGGGTERMHFCSSVSSHILRLLSSLVRLSCFNILFIPSLCSIAISFFAYIYLSLSVIAFPPPLTLLHSIFPFVYCLSLYHCHLSFSFVLVLSLSPSSTSFDFLFFLVCSFYYFRFLLS